MALESHKEKELTRAEALKKVEAWKTINSMLVKANSQYMTSLTNMLTEKQVQHEQLKVKVEKDEATQEEGTEFIFLTGYIQCLKDILNKKAQ